MRSLRTLLTMLLTLSIVSPLAAQPGRGGGQTMPLYDPATEITFDGTITAVTMPVSPMGWKGVHLELDTAEGPRAVHLGPASYLEEKGFSFEAGDRVEVIGSQVECEGEDAVLAREVGFGERRLVLRDESGRPLWAGRQRR